MAMLGVDGSGPNKRIHGPRCFAWCDCWRLADAEPACIHQVNRVNPGHRRLWLLLGRNEADMAYCYRPSSVVYRSVCHSSEPSKNGHTTLCGELCENG